MEKEETSTKQKIYALGAEMLGTFILIYSIENIDNFYGIGLGFWVAITMTDSLSGAHLNPAVTLGVLIDQKRNIVTAILYMVAQCLGGLMAAFLSYPLLGPTHIKNILPPDRTLMADYLSEVIHTGIFVLSVLLCKDKLTAYTKVPWQGAMIVAVTLTACIAMAVPYSGGALNPAAGLSINFAYYIYMGKGEGMLRVWVYVVGPFSGALVAWLLKSILLTPGHKANAEGKEKKGLKEHLLSDPSMDENYYKPPVVAEERADK